MKGLVAINRTRSDLIMLNRRLDADQETTQLAHQVLDNQIGLMTLASLLTPLLDAKDSYDHASNTHKHTHSIPDVTGGHVRSLSLK
jgi:hypothetical protein